MTGSDLAKLFGKAWIYVAVALIEVTLGYSLVYMARPATDVTAYAGLLEKVNYAFFGGGAVKSLSDALAAWLGSGRSGPPSVPAPGPSSSPSPQA